MYFIRFNTLRARFRIHGAGKNPPDLEFQAARGLGTHPGLESSYLKRFLPGCPLDYKKSTNEILRFNWLKFFSKKQLIQNLMDGRKLSRF